MSIIFIGKMLVGLIVLWVGIILVNRGLYSQGEVRMLWSAHFQGEEFPGHGTAISRLKEIGVLKHRLWSR